MKRVYRLSLFSIREIVSQFKLISVRPEGVEIMGRKSAFYIFKIKALTAPAANILKQEALSAGAELATAWNVVRASDVLTDAVLMGTYRQIDIIVSKIRLQQFGLSEVAEELYSAIRNFFYGEVNFKYGNSHLNFDNGPKIMGIVNVTPDSFYDGGSFFSADAAVEHGIELYEQGADIIDIGGQSTRPGSKVVDEADEKSRVIPVIKQLREKIKIPISIDTMKSKVAMEAIENGADIVNDVSAMSYDRNMAEIVKKYNAGIILMHMKGDPETMQKSPEYDDVIAEVLSYLEQRSEYAMRKGIDRRYIAIDPGIGFGKTVKHNLLILKHVKAFKSLGFPVLIGASRKSFIGKLTNTEVNRRLYGSLGAALWAISQGVDLIRVHDVKETKQMISIIKHIMDI